MAARLVFLNGTRAGAALNLGEAPVTIGRRPSRTIVYSPDETVVSTDHATIELQKGHYVIRDEGSKNGTLVNSERVTSRPLEHGDLVQFGEGGPSARFVLETQPGVAPTMDVVLRTTDTHRVAHVRATSAMPAIVAAVEGPPEEESAAKKSRRSFLRLASVVAGTGSAILAGIPALTAFVSPLFRAKREGTWVKLGDAGGFETGTPNKRDFAQTEHDAWVERRSMLSVWVYTDDGETFTIFDARCTHLGCGYNFVTETRVFQCPCHGGRFDPKTGAVLGGPPPRPLDRLPAKVEDGVLFVQIA